MPTADQCFYAAMIEIIEQSEYGTQARLADFLGKQRTYVNDLVRGRRNISRAMQEQIAQFFGLRLEEMLNRGRAILEGGEAGRGTALPEDLTGMIEKLPQNSSARAQVIYDYAAFEAGITVLLTYWDKSLGRYPPGVAAYLNGESNDADLYEESKKFATGLKRYYKKLK